MQVCKYLLICTAESTSTKRVYSKCRETGTIVKNKQDACKVSITRFCHQSTCHAAIKQRISKNEAKN